MISVVYSIYTPQPVPSMPSPRRIGCATMVWNDNDTSSQIISERAGALWSDHTSFFAPLLLWLLLRLLVLFSTEILLSAFAGTSL